MRERTPMIMLQRDQYSSERAASPRQAYNQTTGELVWNLAANGALLGFVYSDLSFNILSKMDLPVAVALLSGQGAVYAGCKIASAMSRPVKKSSDGLETIVSSN